MQPAQIQAGCHRCHKDDAIWVPVEHDRIVAFTRWIARGRDFGEEAAQHRMQCRDLLELLALFAAR